jgi:CBS domain-containing protein
MTTGVRSVEASADVADVARIFVHEHVRSVPVLEHGRIVGILSRRDLLRGMTRPDDGIRGDLLRVVEGYTGELGCWDIVVTAGVATIRRADGAPEVSARVEERALLELAATVGGVVSIRVLPQPARSRQRSPHPRHHARTERDPMKYTSPPPLAVRPDNSRTAQFPVGEPVSGVPA